MHKIDEGYGACRALKSVLWMQSNRGLGINANKYLCDTEGNSEGNDFEGNKKMFWKESKPSEER